MKLKFKVQPYQTHAVESVVDCFAGQVNTAGQIYRIDPGVDKKRKSLGSTVDALISDATGFKNADIQLTDAQLLAEMGFEMIEVTKLSGDGGIGVRGILVVGDKEAAQSDKTPIGLMNGEQLVVLLMEHGIGVHRSTPDLFEIDEKFSMRGYVK